MKIQLKRSANLLNTKPAPPSKGAMEYGELAVNYNASDPTIFIKNSSDKIVEIASRNAYIQGQLWSNNGDKLYPTDLQNLVGIGTSNPTAPLTIQNGTSAEIRLIRTNNSNHFSSISSSGVNSEQLKLTSTASGSIELVVGTTVGAHVDSSGNIGIKKTNPTVALDVSGAGKFSNKVTSAATVDADPTGTLATKGYVDDKSIQVVRDNVIWNENITTGKIHPVRFSSYVGIGKQNPTVSLDVNGDFKVSRSGNFGTKVSSALTVASDLDPTLTTKSYVDAKDTALKSDLEGQINNQVGGNTYWKLSNNDLVPKSVNYQLGIGKNSASQALDVNGNALISGWIRSAATTSGSTDNTVTTKKYVNDIVKAGDDAVIQTVATELATAIQWLPNGNKIYNKNTGYVGIGLNNPTEKLHVNGNIEVVRVYVSDTSPSNSRELTCKSYVDNKVNGIDFWRRSNGNVYLETTTDKVGIGIQTPASSAKLHVEGAIKASNFLINELSPLP